MSSRGVLVQIVDDDAFVREGLSSLIRSAGMMAETFASGEEFLAAVRIQKPNCLIIDVSLSGMSGLGVQQELSRLGLDVPIIFLTGHGDIPTSARAVRSGAAEFLMKPVDDEDLLNAISRCLTFQADGEDGLEENPGAAGTS